MRLECQPLKGFHGYDRQIPKETKIQGRHLVASCVWNANLSKGSMDGKKQGTRCGRIGMVVGPVVTPWATYAATISPPELHAYPKKKKRTIFRKKTGHPAWASGYGGEAGGYLYGPLMQPPSPHQNSIPTPKKKQKENDYRRDDDHREPHPV